MFVWEPMGLSSARAMLTAEVSARRCGYLLSEWIGSEDFVAVDENLRGHWLAAVLVNNLAPAASIGIV